MQNFANQGLFFQIMAIKMVHIQAPKNGFIVIFDFPFLCYIYFIWYKGDILTLCGAKIELIVLYMEYINISCSTSKIFT